MKFCEKLLNLRKQNNMSQEQLADKLGVSRQAVSKWESGSSIPDMEKMMQLCKILNCSLDDLVDDGATGNAKQVESKLTWNDYYKEVLDFITKTLNMFWSMQLVEKVKCLLEMLFLTLLLCGVWGIVGNIIHASMVQILNLFPNTIHSVIYSVASFIYGVFGIVVGFVLLVHIFKIRYLDYFVTIEDSDITDKRVEEPIEEKEKLKPELEERRFIEKKKNKIIIRDPKHSTYSFFGVLAKMTVWFIKFLLVLVAIPCMLCFIFVAFSLVCSLWYLKDGIFFLGLVLAILGCLFINYLVLKFIYYFIFDLKYPFKKIFICLMIGLLLVGTGSSISFCTYLTFKKVDVEDIYSKTKTIQEINQMDENIILDFMEHENVVFVTDDTISNIKMEVEHNSFLECDLYSYQQNFDLGDGLGDITYQVYHLNFYDHDDFVDEINFLIAMIRDKKRFYYDDVSYKVTIYASSEVIHQLKDNYQKYYE